jgi:hypothetical protein
MDRIGQSVRERESPDHPQPDESWPVLELRLRHPYRHRVVVQRQVGQQDVAVAGEELPASRTSLSPVRNSPTG